jgi:lipopolysaccharide export system permease protein
MKILTRYILGEIVGPLLFGFFAFLSMFMGFAFIDLLREAGEYHISVIFIVQLLGLRMPEYLIQTAPIAVLLGTLLGLGNLTSHSETIAMRAGGLNFLQLVIPVVIIGLFLSVGGVLMNEYVVPDALRTYQKVKDAASRKEPTTVMRHFTYDVKDGDLMSQRIYAARFDPKTETMQQVTIEEFDKGRLNRIILTDAMYWNGQGWFFKKGSIYQINSNNFFPMQVDQGYVRYDLNLTPTEISRFNEAVEKKSITELLAYIKKHTEPGSQERRSFLVDWHMKFSIPFASFVLALLGTPLALRPQRRSNAAGFGLCIIFIILWYAFMGIGTYFARESLISPALGAWLPNLALAGYGIHVFAKVKI